ncbi:hypothetical protein ABIC65_001373 [Sphingomonas trueperi]
MLRGHFGGDPRSQRVAHQNYLRPLNAMAQKPLKCSSAVLVQSFLTGRSRVAGVASILGQEQAVPSPGEGLGCYSATRGGVAVSMEKNDRRPPIPSGPVHCTQNEPIGRPEANHFRIGERLCAMTSCPRIDVGSLVHVQPCQACNVEQEGPSDRAPNDLSRQVPPPNRDDDFCRCPIHGTLYTMDSHPFGRSSNLR